MDDDEHIIRICNPSLFSQFLETDKNKVTGVFAQQLQQYIQLVEHYYNGTAIIDDSYPGIGSRIGKTDMYDGCLGKLQRGEADVIATALNYPLDIVNVTQGHIVTDEKLAFSGAFARPGVYQAADIAISALWYSFDWPVYALILSYLVMFAICLRIRRELMIQISVSIVKVSGKDKRYRLEFNDNEKPIPLNERMRKIYFKKICLFDVIRQYLGTNYMETSSPFHKIMSFSLTLFSLLTFMYFFSLMNTELVVPERAKLYKSYEEIMKANVTPIFIRGTNYHEDLKFAPEGSKGKNFWNWAVKKFGEKNIFIEAKILNFAEHCLEGLAGELVIFSGEHFVTAIKTTNCEILGRPFKRLMQILSAVRSIGINWNKFEYSQAYIRSDESAVSKIKTVVMGQRVANSKLYAQRATMLFLRMFEHGHIQAGLKLLEKSNFIALEPGVASLIGPPVAKKWETMNVCKHNNAPVPILPQIDQVVLSNLQVGSWGFWLLLLCSFMSLFVELLVGKKVKINPKKMH